MDLWGLSSSHFTTDHMDSRSKLHVSPKLALYPFLMSVADLERVAIPWIVRSPLKDIKFEGLYRIVGRIIKRIIKNPASMVNRTPRCLSYAKGMLPRGGEVLI